MLGDVRNGFAEYIHNGETAVFVQAVSDAEVEFATDVLRLYLPITTETVVLSEGRTEPNR